MKVVLINAPENVCAIKYKKGRMCIYLKSGQKIKCLANKELYNDVKELCMSKKREEK